MAMTWRILISDGLSSEGLNRLRAAAEAVEGADLAALGSVDAWIVRSRTQVTAEALQAAGSRLKVVGRAGVGVDNIDLAAARARGVVVVNAPQAATIAVAEHALGLMLALARQIPQADASMRRGEWTKAELTGSELAGKTLGLIGVGRIGAALAERAQALGMSVLGYDPLLPPEAIRGHQAEPVTLPELLAAADYLSLHVPLNDQTRGLLGAQALAAVKHGARLICTARGGLVDETALLDALDDGRLAGAALDVFEVEPPGASRLVTHPKVISTPHIAAQTAEAQARAAVDVAAEVLAALRGEPLHWRVE